MSNIYNIMLRLQYTCLYYEPRCFSMNVVQQSVVLNMYNFTGISDKNSNFTCKWDYCICDGPLRGVNVG